MNSDGSGLAGLKGSPFGRSPVRKITGGVGLASKATDPKYLDSCGSSKNRRQPVFTNGFSNLGTSFSNYDLPELYAALKI